MTAVGAGRTGMRYGSVCSGIEAASVAWEPLGWSCQWLAEIDPFACAVLAHHYPKVRNYGDFTTIPADAPAIDLLIGGTPCQSFSVAGLRGGLGDDRGNLALEFCRLVDRTRPRWVVWENVPGVLSSGGGRDFGAILGALGELGYGWAYRVLDAQYFGVPQRRRRVFLIAYPGDWRPPCAVLFERACLSGHPAPRREAGEGIAGTVTGGSVTSRNHGKKSGTDRMTLVPELMTFDWMADSTSQVITDKPGRTRSITASRTLAVAHALTGSQQRFDGPVETFVPMAIPNLSPALRAEGFDASEDGNGRTALIPMAFTAKDYGADVGDIAPTLRAGGHTTSHANAGVMPAVAFAQNTRDEVRLIAGDGSIAGALAAEPGMKQQTYVSSGMAVRRLTPRECERLQGLPDDWTAVPYRGKPAADGPRYRAIGNSMAVPVIRWLGERIQQVDRALSGPAPAPGRDV